MNNTFNHDFDDEINVMLNDEDEAMYASDEQREHKGNKFLNWCKRHKRALIFGGISIAVTAVGIYIYKKNKSGGKTLVKALDMNGADISDLDDYSFGKEAFKNDVTNMTNIANEALENKVYVDRSVNNPYSKKYDWIPDGLKAADDALVWWVADGELNSSVVPSEVGSEAAKVVDAVADKIAKIFEQVDVDDVQCINMMMSLK